MSIYGGDETGALVLHVSPSSVRFGYAGEDAPKVFFPTWSGCIDDVSNESPQSIRRRVYSGPQGAGLYRDRMDIISPFHPHVSGNVSNSSSSSSTSPNSNSQSQPQNSLHAATHSACRLLHTLGMTTPPETRPDWDILRCLIDAAYRQLHFKTSQSNSSSSSKSNSNSKNSGGSRMDSSPASSVADRVSTSMVIDAFAAVNQELGSKTATGTATTGDSDGNDSSSSPSSSAVLSSGLLDPSDHPLLYIEPCGTSRDSREQLAEMFFETYNVPALFLGRDAVMTTFANGRHTALVVDVGNEFTQVVPVYEGFALQKPIQRAAFGGYDLTQAMALMLSKGLGSTVVSSTAVSLMPRYALTRDRSTPLSGMDSAAGGAYHPNLNSAVANAISMANNIGASSNHQHQQQHGGMLGMGLGMGGLGYHNGGFRVLVKSLPAARESFHVWHQLQLCADIKESVGFCSEERMDPRESKTLPGVPYELPDGTVIEVGEERFWVPELLFQPEAIAERNLFWTPASAIHGSSVGGGGSNNSNLNPLGGGSSSTSSSSSSSSSGMDIFPPVGLGLGTLLNSNPALLGSGGVNHFQQSSSPIFGAGIDRDRARTFPGLISMVHNCLRLCDADIVRELASSIILTGGSCQFFGFPDRFQAELQRAGNAGVSGLGGGVGSGSSRLRVVTGSGPERRWMTWVGGSIVASLGTFQQMWFSRKEYLENGASFIHKRCP